MKNFSKKKVEEDLTDEEKKKRAADEIIAREEEALKKKQGVKKSSDEQVTSGFKIIPISPTHIKSVFKNEAVANFANFLYEKMFNTDYRLPAVYDAKMIAYDLTDQLHLPAFVRMDDFFDALIGLGVKTVEDYDKRGKTIADSIKKLAEERISLSTLDAEKRKKFLTDLEQAKLEDTLYTAMSYIAERNLLKNIIRMNNVADRLDWIASKDLQFPSIKQMMEDIARVTSLVAEGVTSAELDIRISEFYGGESLITRVIKVLDALETTDSAVAMFPAYYVHSRLFASEDIVHLNYSPDKKDSKEGDDDASNKEVEDFDYNDVWGEGDTAFFNMIYAGPSDIHNFRMISLKDTLGLNSVSPADVIAAIEAMTMVLFYRTDIMKVVDTADIDAISEQLYKNLDPVSMRTKPWLIPWLTERGDVKKIMDIVQKIHWVILTENIFRNKLSEPIINISNFYQKQDSASLINATRYLQVATTIFDAFIEAFKITVGLCSQYLQDVELVLEDDFLLTGVPKMGYNVASLVQIMNDGKERLNYSLVKRRKRYSVYREKIIESLLSEHNTRSDKRSLMWPWDDPYHISSVVPSIEKKDHFNKITPVMSEATRRSAYDIFKNSYYWTPDFAQRWKIYELQDESLPGDRISSLPLSEYVRLTAEYDLLSVERIVREGFKIGKMKRPPHLVFHDITDSRISGALIEDTLSRFSRVMPFDYLKKFPSEIAERLRAIPHKVVEVRYFIDLADLFEVSIDEKIFKDRFPRLYSAYFDNDGILRSRVVIKFDENPFDSQIFVIGSSVRVYDDITLLKEDVALRYGIGENNLILGSKMLLDTRGSVIGRVSSYK